MCTALWPPLCQVDRIAGTRPLVALLRSRLAEMRAIDARLEALEALGDEEERAKLQRLCDEVRGGVGGCARRAAAAYAPALGCCQMIRTAGSCSLSLSLDPGVMMPAVLELPPA